MIFFKPYYILVTLLISVLVGCSHKPVNFSITEPVSGEGAIVYIYRPDSMSNIVISPDVLIEGKKRFEIKNNAYMSINLPPGQYNFSLNLANRYEGQHSINLNLIDKGIYFLRIDTKMKFQMNNLYKRRFDVLSISKDRALSEIAECRNLNKKNARKKSVVLPAILEKQRMEDRPIEAPQVKEEDVSILTDDPDSEFSISKTKNPFSK
jgi:Protein of unknown function (DUF2846)